MQIQVTKNKVILPDNYIINKGEYHVNVLEFLFSEEYTNEMVKKAIFVSKDESIEQVIINNQCHIPNEMLNIKNFELRVYAYEIENGELVLRYSPTYAVVYLREGSYKSDTSSEETITPTQFEQFEQALNNGLNELETGLEEVSNVDIDASKSGNTATVTITDRQGTEKSVEIFDGDDYIITENDYQEIANIIVQENNFLTSETDPTVPSYVKNITQNDIASWNNKSNFSGNYNDLTNKPTIPNKTSDLTNDSGFITKLVNNLSNYYLKSETYTKTEVNNLIGQIASIQFQLVNELPLTGNSNYIYLVPSSNPTTQNIKDEYIWVNNTWEQIGSTQIDLTNYATENWVNSQINNFLTSTQIQNLINASLDGYVQDNNYVHTDNNFNDTYKSNVDSNTSSRHTHSNKSVLDSISSSDITNWNNKSDFSGSYNDLTNKPTIPTEVTESTVLGWGFTKNAGTITGITMNGASKGTSGVIDLGTVITSHQDISGKENTSNKVTSISSSSTDTQYPSAKCVYNLVNCKIYGIKRSLTTTSSEWHRTDDAIGLEANATKDGSIVYNDFDNIYPWSDIYTYNYDRTTGLETARIGDANFKFDGTNGEVLTKIPEFYYRRYRDDDYEYIQISKCPIDGFIKSEEFSVGRYDSTVINGTIHSYSNTEPEISRTITSFRTLSKAVGSGFGQMDYHYFLLQMLYLVEYADYNSQSKLGRGITSLRTGDSDKALIAESSVNRIVVNSSGAENYKIGQQASIGTSGAWNWSVVRNRTITAIEDYSDGTVTGKAVYFDGDAVNIAVGNALWSTGQKNGHCDSLGMKSGCLANDGKSGIIYRGIENIFGNIWQFVDGINIKDYVAYLCTTPSEYQVDKFDEPYNALGFVNANANGWVKALGYDESFPIASLPTEVGASDSTGTCDYYFQNSGNRIVLVGARWNYNNSAGLWSWHLAYNSSITDYAVGSRLLRH